MLPTNGNSVKIEHDSSSKEKPTDNIKSTSSSSKNNNLQSSTSHNLNNLPNLTSSSKNNNNNSSPNNDQLPLDTDAQLADKTLGNSFSSLFGSSLPILDENGIKDILKDDPFSRTDGF